MGPQWGPTSLKITVEIKLDPWNSSRKVGLSVEWLIFSLNGLWPTQISTVIFSEWGLDGGPISTSFFQKFFLVGCSLGLKTVVNTPIFSTTKL
jgi:hypothetical protein